MSAAAPPARVMPSMPEPLALSPEPVDGKVSILTSSSSPSMNAQRAACPGPGPISRHGIPCAGQPATAVLVALTGMALSPASRLRPYIVALHDCRGGDGSAAGKQATQERSPAGSPCQFPGQVVERLSIHAGNPPLRKTCTDRACPVNNPLLNYLPVALYFPCPMVLHAHS